MAKSLFKSKDITTKADSIVNVLNDIVAADLNAKAEVVLEDFVRKDGERQKAIALLNKEIAAIETAKAGEASKLKVAQKVTNQAALTRKMVELDAQILVAKAKVEEIETLRANAASKRNAFIKAFDEDAYAALINDDVLPRSGLVD